MHPLIASGTLQATSTKVYSLDEKCRRHCVDLVPTLVIQSIHQRLPQDVLKNFSHKMISFVIVFDKQSVAAELAADTAAAGANTDVDSAAAVRAACITACELVIKDAHLAGCTTLSIACSEWTRQTADPVVGFLLLFCLRSNEKHAGLTLFADLHTVNGDQRGAERHGEGFRADVPVLAVHQAAAVRAGLRAVHKRLLQQR
jgi:hypothetical protein